MGLLPLLLFLACHHPTCWEFQTFKDKSTVAQFTPKESYHTLQFEVLHGAFGTWGYLNAIGKGELTAPELYLKIDDQWYKSDVALHEGNQRIRLTEKTTKMIVEALLQGDDVEARCGNYQVVLEAAGTSTRGSTLKAI